MSNNQNKPILPAHLEMGMVELNVRDLSRIKNFYIDAVRLEILEEKDNFLILGRGKTSILKLVQTPHLNLPSSGSAGLYHIAIVFPSRSDLAKTLESIFEKYPESFQGSSDHKVSEAFYFTDPEGNGVELYFDKDRSIWEWKDGKVVMGSAYIDPNEFIINNLKPGDIKENLKMGHVHLRVGDIAKAKDFYVNILGFEITAELPSALFVSAGGYHHHIGMNIWESSDAGMRGETLGLSNFTVEIGDKNMVEEISKNLKKSGHEYSLAKDILHTSDLWGNIIIIR